MPKYEDFYISSDSKTVLKPFSTLKRTDHMIQVKPTSLDVKYSERKSSTI